MSTVPNFLKFTSTAC